MRGPDPLSLSPDGARLAFYDRHRLRMVDFATGKEHSRKIRYGGVIEWLDAQRLLFRASGTALVYDTELRRLRRYPFVRMYGQAHVADRLYGSSRYRLPMLDLETGRKRTVASLTDRGIIDLVGIPERPLIEPGLERPEGVTGSTLARGVARLIPRCRR